MNLKPFGETEGLRIKNQNMKKILTLIVGLMLSFLAFSQKSVAVYVTSSEGISSETKRILGSELVSAITRTDDYIAVERTAEFMAQISQERGNYEIDDAKLYDLGKNSVQATCAWPILQNSAMSIILWRAYWT